MESWKKKIITGMGICCILVISYLLYVHIMGLGTLTVESMNMFGENASWKYGVLLEGDQVLSSSDGLLCYSSMSRGKSVPLCTKADCDHNTEDCTALYTSNVDFIYPYQGKLYLGCSAYRDLEFYRTNLDGSEREKIASYSLGEIISAAQYMVVQSKVYIALEMEDASQLELDEDGNCSDVPDYGELVSFDLETAKYEEIAALGKGYFGYDLSLRYYKDNKLYYGFVGRELPYDEMYDPETGEFLKPEYRDKEMEGVGSIDLATGKIQNEDRYVTGDYVGSEERTFYFLECQKDHILSGDIRLETDGSEDQKIHIKELEQKKGYLCLLKDHFVFNEEGMGEEKGKISFFDRSGNLEFVIDNVDKYVIGEWESYYVLCSFVYPQGKSGMGSYIDKKDVKQLQTKAIGLGEE